MPPPPPPPPPGGPPPPPAMPNFKATAAPDRGALLSQIRGGARLKHAVTNDRSAPIVANKPSNGTSSDGPSRPTIGGASSGGPPMGLGGLFSGGMPKLKPTGQRAALGVSSGGGSSSSSPSPPKESPPKETTSPFKQMDSANQTLAQAIANRAAKLKEKSGAVPLPKPSVTPAVPVKSPSPDRQGPVHHELTTTSTATATATTTITPTTPFPKDVSPPQQSRRGPPLPSKPPAANVNRSISQNQTKRPTHKPPPPPKNAKFGTIGHPKRATVSQTQPLARRQSFGALDSNATALSVTKPQAAPPPPPRNMSVPNNINKIHRNPPPVPPSLHNKKAPPQAPMAKPPPPPPNKTTTMRSTPNLASLVGGGSAVRAGRFESRFTFHNINDLSVTYEPTPTKKYPSKWKKSHPRRAPAPPLGPTES